MTTEKVIAIAFDKWAEECNVKPNELTFLTFREGFRACLHMLDWAGRCDYGNRIEWYEDRPPNGTNLYTLPNGVTL